MIDSCCIANFTVLIWYSPVTSLVRNWLFKQTIILSDGQVFIFIHCGRLPYFISKIHLLSYLTKWFVNSVTLVSRNSQLP